MKRAGWKTAWAMSKRTSSPDSTSPTSASSGPAAKHWLDTVANVRMHGETRKPPVELWQSEKAYLVPCRLHPFDIATVSQVRASKQFRITLETNRYSVPAQFAGQALTLKTYPDRLCLYRDQNLVARHLEATTAMAISKTPTIPNRSLSNAKKPVITSSSCAF